MSYRRKKKSNKSFIITIILLIVLIFTSNMSEGLVKAGNNLTNTIFQPINKVSYAISSEIINAVEDTFGSKNTRSELEKMKAENNKLLKENANLSEIINREDYLKAERNAIENSDYNYIKAQIINSDVNSMHESFFIDKGKNDSIRVNDVVLQAIGNTDYSSAVIGKIVSVNDTTAEVETIKNSSNDVSFINSRSGDYGVIDDYKNKTISGYMLEVDSDVKDSDILLTSGIGGVYPKGLYLGKISNVNMSNDSLRKNITVDSPVDFSHLYRVLILQNKGGTK
ncbi:rod shape-determining protein MreC [Anaerococcus sp. AGMB00486]|uniref:Cell shape-determining protein MreC n=2 Tax=Anaerococcus TaxID=165779 RepID=A0ABX2N8X2_9FIRM|nr:MULTISPECIES: rod shape-determining protein MreC [Anaerococcus]MSS77186.1 rod shape-determining protein MreC [Anaerococcus porci]NVF11009.1 rod shape-determining protein MreC [Anaerococcus faecalis]